MPLCAKCNAIDLRALLTKVIREPRDPAAARFEAYESYQELRDRASTGCELCTIISGRVNWEYISRVMSRPQLGYGGLTFRLSANSEQKAQVQIDGPSLMCRFELFPLSESSFSDDEDIRGVLSRYIGSNTGLPETLQYASRWLEECNTSHTSCSSGNSRRLPTRVIIVGSATQDPRLVETGGTHGRWAALSYCWGTDATFTLTRASMERLKRGVPLNDFPLTLRDAIDVTRKIGLAYIWIDALCIVQDSIEDWQNEAPQMKSVYSNADVVIAATCTDDVNGGIFRARDIKSAEMPWRYTHPKTGRGQTIGIRLEADESVNDQNLRFVRSRWMSRGWTMQEDFLAKRLLVFTEDDMTWECLEHSERESGQYHRTINISNRPDKRSFMSRYWKRWMQALEEHGPVTGGEATRNTKASEDMARWAGYTPYQMWNFTVMEYNKRRFTKYSDRLPALSGLAALFHEITGSEYCAGMWRTDLVCSLLWRFDVHQPEARELQPYKWMPAAGEPPFTKDIELTSSGPSWSWVSVKGDILDLRIARSTPKAGEGISEPRILDVKTCLAVANDQFGSVTSGELTIEANSVEWGHAEPDRPQFKIQELVAEILTQPRRRNQRGFYAEYLLRHQPHPGQVTAALIFGFGGTTISGHGDDGNDGVSVLLIESIMNHDPTGASQAAQPLSYGRVGKLDIRTPFPRYTELALTDIRYQSQLEIDAHEECIQRSTRRTYVIV